MISLFRGKSWKPRLLGWRKIKPSSEGFIFWHLVNFPSSLDKEKTIKAFRDVYDQWQQAFDEIEPKGRRIVLESTSDYNKAHIKMIFVPPFKRNVLIRGVDGISRYYTLPEPLDGSLGTLAYVVQNKHEIYFDDGEKWSDMSDMKRGVIDLFDVAFHEVGHVFDLAHGDGVMTTFYEGERLKLSQNNFLDLQKSYGKIKAKYEIKPEL